MGKTRIAIRLAAHLQQRGAYRDGVAFVDLRDVKDVTWVPERILQDARVQIVSAEGADLLATVRSRLQGNQMLLVLDNCDEIAADLGDVIGELLDACPGVRVLATSRTTFELPGEYQFPLMPLHAPYPDGDDEGSDSSAMTLFATRALAVDPNFDLDQHRQAVARICHRLGGFPLLVEIITSKLRLFTVPQLEARLDEVFGDRWSVATRTRTHRTTFRAVMDLSWRLCTPAERRAWQRLSVFRGGVSLEAAEAVLGADSGTEESELVEDTEVVLDGLIRQSLLVRDAASDQPRFRLLEPIQQVGADKLRVACARDRTREAHAAWCEHFVAQAAAQWYGPQEARWLRTVHAELPNLRAALDWCASSGNPARGIRIVTDLLGVRVPFRDGTLREWRHHLQRMLALYDTRDQLWVAGMAQCAIVAVCQGSRDAAPLLQQLRDTVAQDDPHLAYAEAVYATYGSSSESSSMDSVTLTRRAVRLLRGQTGVADGDLAMATMWTAIAAGTFGDPTEGERATSRFLVEAEQAGAPWHLSWAQWVRAVYLLQQRGDHEQARALLHQSLPAQRSLDDYWGPIWWVAVSAWLATACGQHVRAAELTGATDRVMHLTGIQLHNLRGNGDLHRSSQEQVRQAMDADTYEAAYRRGGAVPDYATAIALALEETTLDDFSKRAGTLLLTPREQEVAQLVVDGLTNAEIAARSGVSEKTIKTHVSNILHKLGCSRRQDVKAKLQELTTQRPR